jgi:hypothetical protein
MSPANVIATISTVIAGAGVFLAAIQYLENKRRTRTERERLAGQEERLRTAVTAAHVGSQSADLIVQRAKEPDVSVTELQNIARILRGTLEVLAEQLSDEKREIAARREGDGFRSVTAEPEMPER